MRAGALLALLAAIAGLYGLTTTGAFTVQRTTIEGVTWTPERVILAALSIPEGQNSFALNTAELEGRLLEIPAVGGAAITVALPDELRVEISEREALMAWLAGDRTFLVDASGLLFADLAGLAAPATGPPAVDDRRAASAGLEVGSVLDTVSLDAALRLGSLVPADIGSAAERLNLRVDDTDGFVITGTPAEWTAVFGFYTPTLRTTELIPGQVRLLRSLLAGRETGVLKIILADERSGTYIPRETPRPTARPAATPKP